MTHRCTECSSEEENPYSTSLCKSHQIELLMALLEDCERTGHSTDKSVKYQCSIFCHCTKLPKNIACYGNFEYCVGICPNCGATHIGRQIPLADGGHRYVTEIRHTVKSTILHIIGYFGR